jgi:hypothetical protein
MEVHANHLVRAVRVDSQFRMAVSLEIGQLVDCAEFLVSFSGKIVKGIVEIRRLFRRVRAAGDRLVVFVVVGGNLIGVVLLDALTLRNMRVHIGADSINVSHADQEVNALGVCHCRSGTKYQCANRSQDRLHWNSHCFSCLQIGLRLNGHGVGFCVAFSRTDFSKISFHAGR